MKTKVTKLRKGWTRAFAANPAGRVAGRSQPSLFVLPAEASAKHASDGMTTSLRESWQAIRQFSQLTLAAKFASEAMAPRQSISKASRKNQRWRKAGRERPKVDNRNGNEADIQSRLLSLPAELREQIWLHTVINWGYSRSLTDNTLHKQAIRVDNLTVTHSFSLYTLSVIDIQTIPALHRQ